MSEDTKIEWCDHTFNPWEGCTKVSTGCANCYAEARNHRFGNDNWGKGKPRRRTSEANWRAPLKWNRQAELHAGEAAVEGFSHERPRVFCASLADVFDSEVEIGLLADLFCLIRRTQHLDWLLLTKRPENFEPRFKDMLDLMCRKSYPRPAAICEAVAMFEYWRSGKPPSNVWLGTSVEDQPRADERIPALLRIPARVRFLSVEPLLGPVDFSKVPRTDDPYLKQRGETGVLRDDKEPDDYVYWLKRDQIHWIIVGGESGRGARPCNVQWVRDVVRQSRAGGAAAFVKQLGAYVTTDNANCDDWSDEAQILAEGEGFAAGRVRLSHPKGGDPAEWPESLRVREFPRMETCETR